jgi:hypothetical protein
MTSNGSADNLARIPSDFLRHSQQPDIAVRADAASTGMFKNGDAENFPWLKADGTPTLGDWFRELGYSTHYFGKWHVSDPPEHSLEGCGFGDWELS